MLLGLDQSWHVENVRLDMPAKKVEIALRFSGGSLSCPECGKSCTRHDLAGERIWRHLDTMQFETLIKARIPRSNCSECGIKTVRIPWADKHSRFTLMFEAFAIEVLQACGDVQSTSRLLKLDWDTANTIMSRSVERGTASRSTEDVVYVGIDEKSFRKGQDYVSVMTDLEGSRVLEVVEGRDQKAAEKLWKTLPAKQRGKIKAVAVDMWPAFLNATEIYANNADVVYDRFHVSKHLNEAVDQVRRQENKALRSTGDESLKGTKQLWLFNEENVAEEKRYDFAQLRQQDLKTGRAWTIKENLRLFWTFTTHAGAEKFFEQWYEWAIRSRLKPIVDKAKMLKKHIKGLLNFVKHKITNAKSEGINSKIQHVKYSARGLRSFKSYRVRILFFCGKLDLKPEIIGH